MDEGRRIKRLTGILQGQLLRGQPAQFVVDQRQELVGGVRIAVGYFDNSGQLQKQGSSLFSAPAGVAPQPASPNVHVVQGSIEQSNVSAVSEMARMVEITRTYEQISSLLQQENTERTTALEKLSAVPA